MLELLPQLWNPCVKALVLVVSLYIIVYRPEDRIGRDYAFFLVGLIVHDALQL